MMCDPSIRCDVLQPFEITLEQAALVLSQDLLNPQATEAQIRAALVEAAKRGEIKPKRGIVERYPWETPEAIFDANDLAAWLESTGLDLETNDAWHSYYVRELRIEGAMEGRLEALRTIAEWKAEAPEAWGADDTTPATPGPSMAELKLAKTMEDNIRLRRELAAEREEPDPRNRKTMLRIIGALADLAGIDDAMPPKTAAHAINSKLESMGQKGMKPDTIAAVITAARRLANETID